jgi:hypothetical protein
VHEAVVALPSSCNILHHAARGDFDWHHLSTSDRSGRNDTVLGERCSTQQFPRDPNLYHLGRIGEHNIAIAGLPEGLTSIAPATTVAERLWVTFRSVKALLLVGIGGTPSIVGHDATQHISFPVI